MKVLKVLAVLAVLEISLLGFFSAIALGAMSKSKAITESHKIWGSYSRVAQTIGWGDAGDTYQIGYSSPGCYTDFAAVGTGTGSWDAAFASMPPDKGIKGTYNGTRDLIATTPPPPVDPPDTLSKNNVPGTTVSVQFVIDGRVLGDPVPVVPDPINPKGWTATQTWDTTMYSNGNHYVCQRYLHPDGSMQISPPAMFLVQNP